ncbi:hypothetical protein AYL99_02671 [Fonsecaea erecta]|uniref:B30.2/SPRY domain-containing protein n=1 Tax=Fonsecaea erecta TaxID=1367422 RepID=A0A178ZUJ6_9EURO|nr:hypothetical protein AYL99_02671 [Fonsecaea erecta]OAP63444.1 hypothetical protein AYL99_02671 [Fonsecaea erecta]
MSAMTEEQMDFESRAWESAREQLRKKYQDADARGVDAFLSTRTTIDETKQACQEMGKAASQQYQNVVKQILEKIDLFMKAGDVAVKSAPESIGLAWTGVRLCFHSFQDDFKTFSLFGGATLDIVGIFISCRAYWRLIGVQRGLAQSLELHQHVETLITDTYQQVADFSYNMWKEFKTPKILRIVKGVLRSNSSKFEGLLASIKEAQKRMGGYAQQAVTLLIDRKLDMSQEDLQKIQEMLKSSTDIQTEIKEELERQKNRSPFGNVSPSKTNVQGAHVFSDLARDQFEANMNYLNVSYSREIQKTALDRKECTPGTCNWIFDLEEYGNWHNARGSSLLWVSGGGGFGKSFLMSSVIRRLQAEMKQPEDLKQQREEKDKREDSALCYFLCNRGNEASRSTEKILDYVLVQLYEHVTPDSKPSLDRLDKANQAVANYLVKARDSKAEPSESKKSIGREKGFASFQASAFEEAYIALAEAVKKEAYVVIDALDECDDREEQGFIDLVLKLATSTRAKVKILICSRREDDINQSLDNEKVSHIMVEDNNGPDVKRFVESELSTCVGWTKLERELAAKVIIEKAKSWFKYVDLVMSILRQPWQRPLSKKLEDLPEGLHDMYVEVLHKTDPSYRQFLETFLTWTILAPRKVTATEIVDAYTEIYINGNQEEDIQGLDSRDKDIPFRDQITKVGGALIKVDWHTKVVSLSHETVKEAFLRTEEVEIEPTICKECGTRKSIQQHRWTLSSRMGNFEMTRVIFKHLNSPLFYRMHMQPEYDTQSESDSNSEYMENEDESQAGNGEGRDEVEVGKNEDKVEDEVIVEEEKEVDSEKGDEEAKDGENEKDSKTSADTLINNAKESDGDDGSVDRQQEDSTVTEIRKLDSPPTNGEDNAIEITTIPTSGGPSELYYLAVGPDDDDDDDAKSTNNSDVNDHISSSTLDGEESMDETTDADSDDETPQNLEIDAPAPTDSNQRYEIVNCIYHLQKVLEQGSPKKEKWDQLWNDIENYFRAGSRKFKSWIHIEAGRPDSALYAYGAYGVSPLHVAAAYGLVPLVERLIKRGDRVNATTLYGQTPLHYAARLPKGKAKQDLCRHLLQQRKVDANFQYTDNDSGAQTAFHILLTVDPSIESVQLFLENRANPDVQSNYQGWSALHYFATYGEDVQVLDALIKKRADINAQDREGETPLHMLVRRPKLDPMLLRAFIDKEADVNQNDKDNQQPLFEVASSGNKESMGIILGANPDVHHQDRYGMTALHNAALNGFSEGVSMLIEKDANPTCLDDLGRSPFFLACEKGDLRTVEFLAATLKERDPSYLDKPSSAGKTPLRRAATKGHALVVEKILTQYGEHVNINAVDEKLRRTALHVAALLGFSSVVQALLNHQARSDVKDRMSHTPLTLCCKAWSDLNSADLEPVILLLIDNDEDAARADAELLNTAIMCGSVRVVKKLRQLDVDVTRRDESGWTALELARQYKNYNIQQLLSTEGVTVGKRPCRWVGSKKSHKLVEILDDGLTLRYHSDKEVRCSFLSDHPIPSGTHKYYFEVSVDEAAVEESESGLIVALGLSHRQDKLVGRLPGLIDFGRQSWAFHGDDGTLYQSSNREGNGSFSNNKFGFGDTIGCGVDLDKDEAFYTVNGKRIMKTAFSDLYGRIYLAVALNRKAIVRTNFGSQAFKWEPANQSPMDFEADLPADEHNKLEQE